MRCVVMLMLGLIVGMALGAMLVKPRDGEGEGKKKEERPTEAPQAAPEPTEPAKPVPLPKDKATANVHGRVRFKGTKQAEWTAAIDTSNYETCAALHKDKPLHHQTVVVGEDGGLANVLVYVSQGAERYLFEPATEPVVLEQKECQYSPRVFGVMANQPIKIVNADPTLHNIHALPKQNAGFNLQQPKQGQADVKRFDTPEVPIPIKCDVHPWMGAYAGVFAHPWFAVSGADGGFELKGVVPGAYTLTLWHEKFGSQSKDLTVTEGGAAVEFTIELK
ncbi:MAG: carboxypeptidase regulatory-like domain-containing protein [Planctomycetota bacterium]|nr:carboxypeptidase regulatory-like domain-containing protein [Planctomycetota bacterium]